MRLRILSPLVVCTLLTIGCDDAADMPTSLPRAQLALQHPQVCELGLPGAEALHAIDAVHIQVDALRGAHALNRGQARALHNKLDKAAEHLEHDRLCPAVASLRAFLEQVEDFVEDGVLTEGQAAPLLSGVRAVLEGAPPKLGFEAISAGSAHTCALTHEGRAYCWGYNELGQVGDGTTEGRLVPTPVSGEHRYGAISGGGLHTCALATTDEAYCWGDNRFGAIGDGTTTDRRAPTPMSGGLELVAISAGHLYTCAVQADGDAHCWGINESSTLGDGMTMDRHVPTPVSGDHAFGAITADQDHACALEADGDAYCWGVGGQIGDGTFESRSVPTAVSGGHEFVTVSAGALHTCAIDSDGDAWCWGNNFYGQLGNPSVGDETLLAPVPVSGGHTFVAVSAGGHHTCGIDSAGDTYCWGDGEYGLGTGVYADRPVPTLVSGGHEFVEITAGGAHTCGLEADGDAFCWGSNANGELGDGTTTERLVPTPVLLPEAP